MYKCVLFDLDGTLADTDLLVVEGFLHFFRKYKPNTKVSFSTLASFSGPSLKDSMKKYFPEYDVDELVQEFREYTFPLYDTYIELYDGTIKCLELLLSKGIKMGIVTSKMRESAIVTLKHYGLDKYIECMICVDDVSSPKPSPEGVFIALSKIGIKKEDTLYVGDAITDLETANNAGIDCCLVSWNVRGRHNNIYPKFYVDNYQELEEVILNGK